MTRFSTENLAAFGFCLLAWCWVLHWCYYAACTWLTAVSFKLTAGYHEINFFVVFDVTFEDYDVRAILFDCFHSSKHALSSVSRTNFAICTRAVVTHSRTRSLRIVRRHKGKAASAPSNCCNASTRSQSFCVLAHCTPAWIWIASWELIKQNVPAMYLTHLISMPLANSECGDRPTDCAVTGSAKRLPTSCPRYLSSACDANWSSVPKCSNTSREKDCSFLKFPPHELL